MRFSKKSEYALRALIELTKAYDGTPVRRHQIAERQNIPIVFLAQLLLALKHAGLLASTRGAQGGYALIKPPAKVTLGQVIRILDGAMAPIGCVSKTAYKNCHNCPYAKHRYCPFESSLREVRKSVAGHLDDHNPEHVEDGVNDESKALARAAPCDRLNKRSPFPSTRAGKSRSDDSPGKPIVVAARAVRLNSERCNGKPSICRRYGCAALAAACAMLPTCLTSS